MRCVSFFASDDSSMSCSLIELRDFGGLVRPAIDVVTLVEMVNTIVDQEEKSSNILADKCFRQNACEKS